MAEATVALIVELSERLIHVRLVMAHVRQHLRQHSLGLTQRLVLLRQSLSRRLVRLAKYIVRGQGCLRTRID